MKKCLMKILVFIVLVTMTNINVFAGDIPEFLMEGRHKALFIGEIKEMGDEYYTIVPLNIMMGSIETEELQVEGFEGYYGTKDKPQVGDYIVAVLLEDQEIDESWLFKATSSDYQRLSLVSEKYNMVERYEDYINEGAYIEAQKKIDANRTSYTLHSREKEEIKEVGMEIEEIQPSGEDYEAGSGVVYLAIGIGIVLAIGGLGYLGGKLYRKSRQK